MGQALPVLTLRAVCGLIRLAVETVTELNRMAGRQAAAPMSLPGLSVGHLGDIVLRVIEVICALINPAAAKADPLIQVRPRQHASVHVAA